MKDALARINHSVWELAKLVAKHPENYAMRADFLRYCHESRLFGERRRNIPEEGRSFLMLQERESLCCFLLHGIGGSPAEMRPLGEHLFRSGHTVYGIRLALGGDGAGARPAQNGRRLAGRLLRRRDGRDRSGYDWERCLADADTVLGMLLTFSRSICVFGFSFGGALASILWKAAVEASLIWSRNFSSRSASAGVSELPTLAGFGSSSDGFRDTTHMLVGVGATGFGYEGDVIALTLRGEPDVPQHSDRRDSRAVAADGGRLRPHDRGALRVGVSLR